MADGFLHPAMQEFAERTTIGIPFLDAPAQQLASSLGLELTVIKFAFALYLSFPLGFVNRALPFAPLRHVYTLATGVLLIQYVFGARYLHVFNVATACYLLLTVLPMIPPLRGYAHIVAALAAFGHLSFRHLTRSGVTANNVDDSVVHMVLTIKLYCLAFNLYDGTAGSRGIEKTLSTEEGARSSVGRMMADRKARSLAALPGLLEFYAYVFNFTTMLVGPAFEITEYLRSQSRASLPSHSRLPRAARVFLEGVVCMAANIVLQPKLPISGIYDNALSGMVWWEQILRAHGALFLLRAQYYGVWKIAEAASIAAGYGYHEGDKGASWDGTSNVDAIAVETSGAYSTILRHWNKNTQSWLERYVFKRVTRAYSINRWVTFLFSAFWHGFYAGYYMAFISVPVFEMTAQYVYAVWRPILTRAVPGWTAKGSVPHTLYTLGKIVLVQLSLDYALGAFTLLYASPAWAFWRAWGFIGLALPAALAAVTAVVAAVAGGSRKDRDGKKKE